VTGAGGNFCSGADLRAMSGDAADADETDVQGRMKADPDIVYKALFRHYRPKKPIIAAVEGVAIAGGTEILQAMEIRVAGESARFGVSEARGRSTRWAARRCACRARSRSRSRPRSC
jgi:enoyl-CoA hydratase